MRILIPCAGKASRWGDGTNKHLVRLCGEPVLHRTVRLIGEMTPDAEVLLVVENHQDPAYKIDGSSRRKAKLGAAQGDVDKIASSLHLWDDRTDTLIVYGDVWWSRPALAAALASDGDWSAFGRIAGAGGELFGFHFPAGSHTTVTETVQRLSDDHDRLATFGYRGRPVRGGWALYRALCGVPLDRHGDHGHWVDVNDWTEDLDGRKDWDAWCWRWAKASEAEREAQV